MPGGDRATIRGPGHQLPEKHASTSQIAAVKPVLAARGETIQNVRPALPAARALTSAADAAEGMHRIQARHASPVGSSTGPTPGEGMLPRA